jgi:fructoselysine-6-P-deglycase FrlB-like protein
VRIVSFIEEEIASQPACWREAVGRASVEASALPREGERVIALGCGTSWFMAQAYAAARSERFGAAGVTDAFTPTELPADRPVDRVIVISRSGTTTEVIDAIRLMHDRGVPTIALTASGGSPVAELAGHTVTLGFADERSVVQTRFATSGLAFLRTSLGEELGGPIAEAERAVVVDLPVDPAVFDRAVFLGAGWSVGIAHEAALKLREAAQAHTESYPAMEYRHGPIALAGPDTLVWILGSPDDEVAAQVAATGATVRRAELDPMAELILIQRFAVALAEKRGLDPDRPPHLTRSVVLHTEPR